MRYLLASIMILLLLTGCTMHPPSTAAFMDALNAPPSRSHSVRGEFSQYEKSDDGWDSPLSYDLLVSNGENSVWGFGFQPSPYFTFGTGNEYAAVRGWISMPWVIGTAIVLCPACFIDTDDDDEEYDDYWTAIDDEKKDFDFVGTLEEWAGAFAGGLSVIEQIPIGDHFSFGIEQYIARNVWIPKRDNRNKSDIEAGFGAFANLWFRKFSIGIDAHYGFMDLDPDRTRFAFSVSVSYHHYRQYSE